jgi:hypothetical protein
MIASLVRHDHCRFGFSGVFSEVLMVKSVYQISIWLQADFSALVSRETFGVLRLWVGGEIKARRQKKPL